MDNSETEKAPKVVSKSFMAVGPTLHYSHENVLRCWLLAFLAFGISCLFWSKILTGSFWSFNLGAISSPSLWHLGPFVIRGVSIFEYPWQIPVLGLLMGILGVVPVLVSQLLSFSYSVPFILVVAFFANLPGFAVCLFVSCVAAACRPLRFRSRFIAIALCMAPQLVYWAYFGAARGVEPIKWGFSFTPWISAWLVGLGMAGLVLGIGHFTRYRPGLVWATTALVLVTAVVVFEVKIGFAELDYQLYVAENNPEEADEFHDHSITQALDDTLTDAGVRRYLAGFFYPTEPILLRAELKREIVTQLRSERWPSWFIVPEPLDYQGKKEWLFRQYDLFISSRPRSRRMPIALYYKALLSEYSPEPQVLEQSEVLHFYSDYPYERSREIWYRLYKEFGDSPESVEARWRIAKHWADQGRFEQADALLVEAQDMAAGQLKLLEREAGGGENIFSLFCAPADSVMTEFKLVELQRKLNQLRTLISGENRTGKPESAKRLAEFAVLNPHSSDYAERLGGLLEQMGRNDQLRDNILLAQAKLVADERTRAERLSDVHRDFADTDGGMQALYELALLKIHFWRQQSDENPEQKKGYLADARATLNSFISLYPEGMCIEQVKKNLEDLPTAD